MKNIENQLKCIRADYGQKIPLHIRQRLDKYLMLFKELSKISAPKPTCASPKNMFATLEEQCVVFRREIQGEIKLAQSDFQSFVWKLDNIDHASPPKFFDLLQIGKEKSDPSLEKARTDFNFSILDKKTSDLIQIGSELILDNDFCRQTFDKIFIERLLRQISLRYNIMAYHNFSHAFSVFLMFYQCSELAPGFKNMFTSFELFVAFIAAFCHDMNHKGTNSSFEVKKKSDLAVKYNNQSVLENMHIANFYRMNKEIPDLNFIAQIKSPAQKIAAKRLLNQLILATDIMKHARSLDQLKQLKGKDPRGFNSQEREIVLENLFHACDIGNPALEFNNYINWSILLAYEFNNQAELERNLGVQVSPNFTFVDYPTHYRSQIGFIDYLALPLWKQLGSFFPELVVLSKAVAANRKQLQQIVAALD